MKQSAVAIITARGGSKRIPRKNIRNFVDRPIIAYSIEAALQAECFSEVMVSTDDQEIADIAQKLGAKIPFLRSAPNSNDTSTTANVIEEVLREYEKRGQSFEYACCIYPTAPFVTAAKLRHGLKLLSESDADSVVPVVRFGYPIQRALKIESGKLQMIWPENINAMSQDLPKSYHDVGQFYWARVNRFLAKKQLFTDHALPMEIDELEVQDIDHEIDWKLAELKYQLLTSQKR